MQYTRLAIDSEEILVRALIPGRPTAPRRTLFGGALRSWAGLAALALILTSSACGSTNATTGEATAAMTRASRLALGTLNLEGTGEAVDARSASQLLPLWQLLADLSTSTTAAPEEVAAVVDAIEAGMTESQLAAIQLMDISKADIAGAAQGAGLGPASITSSTAANVQPAAAVMDPALGADVGGGVPPDGGAMPLDGGAPEVDRASTPAPGSLSSGGVFQRVIELLQGKSQV